MEKNSDYKKIEGIINCKKLEHIELIQKANM